MWSATVPLISFECIEWHATDRVRRQFGLTQGVPSEERDLGASHGEVLTGPKNQDWANTHSRWVMQWTNRYSHILSEDLEHLHYPLEIYMHWYRDAYGDPLQLSNLVFEENPEGPPPPPPAPEPEPEPAAVPPPPPPPEPPQQGVEYFAPYVPNTHPSDYYSVPVPSHQQFWGGPHFEYGEQPSFNQLLGFMASGSHHTYSGNYVDIPTDHQAHLGGITPARRSFDLRSRVRTSSDNSGVRMSVDSSRSTEAAGGIIQSGNPRRIPITLPHEETDNYLVDHPEDEVRPQVKKVKVTTSELILHVGVQTGIHHPPLTGLQRSAESYTKI
ncbi:breast cancer anti-estrogen resistance protein 1-like [Arachis ipaensis]|uniref:breast cancer anti-estrogen resistance protein 1-like n=1 Tax=Arachis ipaensis TaxID=130454 RepID=UPI000A2B5445|nr:breast cancer anti-estrogen resistance protein 1-like [Arachis ipaensis]